MKFKIYRHIPLGVCLYFTLLPTLFSQSLIAEFGYANVRSEAGFNCQLNFDRYFSNRFGILANVTYINDSSNQLGYTAGLFFQILDLEHHLLLTEVGIGTSYYEPKEQTFPSVYWSIDYFYKISLKHFIGISAGINGGDHATQFVNVNYLFNTYPKDKNFNNQKSRFAVMLEPTLILSNPSASTGLNIIGAYEIGSVVSAGIGAGFVYWLNTSGMVPVFADIRLNLLPGKITPYSIFRFGYNIGTNLGTYQAFGDMGLGVKIAITERHGIYADCKLRKNQATDFLRDQFPIVSAGYKFSL